MHSIVGTLMLISTISAGILAIKVDKDSLGVHGIAGIITLFFVTMTAGLGLTRILMPICCDMRWKTHQLQKIKRLHKYLAYFLILGS